MTRAKYYQEIEQTSLAIRATLADIRAQIDAYEGQPSTDALPARIARLVADVRGLEAALAVAKAAVEAERAAREREGK